MKKIVLASLLLACLPYLSWAQSSDDDLYFIPKKKTEKKASTTQTVNEVIPRSSSKFVYNSNVVIKDASGKTRDIDEYNRRYTSRDNKFSLENDTLYVEEKPYNERGEWVNGFEGSQDDYEYAMRIVRFRNPRYAIPISSPLYWDVLYSLPSWEWNVYDDGLFVYAFPTNTNRFWWNWRWNYPYGGWGSSINYYFPGSYNRYWGCNYSWNFDYNWNYYGWNDNYYDYYNRWHGPLWGHSHTGSSHGWSNRGVRNNRRAEYTPNNTSGRDNIRPTRGTSDRYSGRVVSGNDNGNSVRPYRGAQPNRNSVRNESSIRNEGSARGESTVRGERTSPSSSYTRPSMNRGESSYSRPSSTRSSVREGNNALNRTYESSRSRSNNNNNSYNNNYNSSRSSYQSSGSSSSSYQSSGSSSGSSSSRSTSGGGARRR